MMMLVYFFLHTLIMATATAADSITTDQDALLALKSRIIRDPSNFLARNWNTSTPVCNWTGVTCNTNMRRVTTLNITQLFLTGTIPSELGNLSSLQVLDLSFNRLSGPMPSSIFTIQALRIIDLSDNQLSGAFPSSIRNISSLQFIDLGNNRLSDQLPSNVFNYLPSLEGLYLTGNLFHGEIPSTLSNCEHLQLLVLALNNFSGSIPKEIGNLTKLQGLYLDYNQLQGEIPGELGNLAELQILWLHNNLLTGIIPPLFNLSSLSVLSLSDNNLTGSLRDDMCQGLPVLNQFYISDNQITGPIPKRLWQCKQLMHVSLSSNQFTGSIPSDIGNMTSLIRLSLINNYLTGEIPHEIGNLHNLDALVLDSNKLVGVVPATIFNISTLKTLGVTNNMLSGKLPSSIENELPNFEKIHLASNNFSGIIPSFIFNASKLSILELSYNSFSGSIPNSFNNLRSLQRVGLGNNLFRSSTPELSFFSSLSNCKNLSLLVLGENPLGGTLPSSIGNLSNSLEKLYLQNCNITGKIPEEISKLTNLILLQLGSNKLNGSIPISLGRLENLQGLSLGNNKLEGSIPNDLCNMTNLVEFFLNNNKLSGSIPACFANLTSLRSFYLSSNELTSGIPSFGNLKDILEFNLSSNSLTGPIPLEIGSFKIALKIDLSSNNLSGDIPSTIGGLTSLELLSLGYNGLQGPIPESFGNLISLKYLNLSNNNLSGAIPVSLEKLGNLKELNLSFNNLEGEIPRRGSLANFSADSFMGNNLLCGSPDLQVQPCKNNKTSHHGISRRTARLVAIVLTLSIGSIVVITLVLRFVLISRCQKRAKELRNDAYESPQVTQRKFSYLELLRATDEFSESKLIGRGSFGSVYKARLQDEVEVAVKVFHLQIEGASKSFDAECEVLKSIRHRNLVKIISSCSNEEFKALVLEYMPTGSLDKCLYSNNCNLDIFQRLNVMIDVASALEYLHSGHSTPVVHCDLKPGNVLLDDDLVAHVGDFGIAKLLNGEDQSMAITQTLATIGYMAPEYGSEGQVSAKGDVYSYGIMLIETFTKKKPTDDMFTGEMTLKSWVSDLLPVSVTEVVDANLLSIEDEHFTSKEQCLSSVLNLAMECTSESPEERISSKEIVTRLLKVRVALLADVQRRPTRRQ